MLNIIHNLTVHGAAAYAGLQESPSGSALFHCFTEASERWRTKLTLRREYVREAVEAQGRAVG